MSRRMQNESPSQSAAIGVCLRPVGHDSKRQSSDGPESTFDVSDVFGKSREQHQACQVNLLELKRK